MASSPAPVDLEGARTGARTAKAPTGKAPTVQAPTVQAPTVQAPPAKTYNTRRLGLRLGVDAACGFTAASLVAPIIAIIDRSIMEKASGAAHTLAGSLRASFAALLRRPQDMVRSRPFALICAVYGTTYLSANAVDTAAATAHNRPASHVTAGVAKFAVSSATNGGIGIYKDQVFVRMFGPPGAVPRPVPLPSYALFVLRDALTIFSSFIVPARLGAALSARFPPETSALFRAVSAQTVAQFAAPALTQFVSTPIHLLGLDLYNRAWQPRGAAGSSTAGRGPASWADRLAVVRKSWVASSVVRMGRIVPAYGIGGVVNLKMRKALMTRLE